MAARALYSICGLLGALSYRALYSISGLLGALSYRALYSIGRSLFIWRRSASGALCSSGARSIGRSVFYRAHEPSSDIPSSDIHRATFFIERHSSSGDFVHRATFFIERLCSPSGSIFYWALRPIERHSSSSDFVHRATSFIGRLPITTLFALQPIGRSAIHWGGALSPPVTLLSAAAS